VTRSWGLWVLWVFLIVELTIHYQTRFIPGTLHSWVLVVGCLLTLPELIRKYGARPSRLPGDYRIIALMAVCLLVGFIVNWSSANPITLQAYVLSLASYVFVREQGARLPLAQFYSLNKWFLIANSVLILAQFQTDHFYPARFLAAGNPPLLLPSGFADGPTKNGVIHGAALAIVFARVVALRIPLASIEGAALLLGAFSLLLTTSRAGVAGVLATTVLCTAIVLLTRRRGSGAALRPRVPATVLVALVVLTVLGGGRYAVTTRQPVAAPAPVASLPVNTQQHAGAVPPVPSPQVNAQQYAANVVAFKFVSKARPSTMMSDDSIATRFATMHTAVYILVRNPPHAIVGTGVGTFSKLFARFGSTLPHTGDIDFRDTSAHNSYLEFLVEAGLVSFVLLLMLVLQVGRVAFGRPDWYDALPLASMVSVAMGAMMFHDILRGRVFWVPLGLLAAFAYSRTAAGQPAAEVVD
jgi:hypothetical protein